MNELLRVTVNENDEQVVSGRDLHNFLGVSTPYTQWFDRMCEYGFAENLDFINANELSQKCEGSRMVMREIVDHLLKIDMAKELCMLARSDKGKQARRYFLQIEREWNDPAKVMARALRMSAKIIDGHERVIAEQTAKIEADKPKVIFADAVTCSNDTILVRELAKILKGNGIDIGEKRLFERLRNEGFLIRREGADYNTPSQYSMERGLFKVKETVITHSDGRITVRRTPKVTGKGQTYFVNYFLTKLDPQI